MVTCICRLDWAGDSHITDKILLLAMSVRVFPEDINL